MKILRIWAENVRGISKFTEIELTPIGVTLISAPNEFGKSTLAEVPRHLIQTPYSSKAVPVKSLQPFNKPGVPVTMGMRFEIEGKIYEIVKNFVKSPSALLKHIEPLGKDLTNDEAEEKLAQILEPFDGSLFNLVYMKQGLSYTAISSSSSMLKGNTTLQTFVDEAASRETDTSSAKLIEKAQKEHDTWWTNTGKPATSVTSNGKRLVDATNDVATLQQKLESVKATQISRESELAAAQDKAFSGSNTKAIYETQQRIAELDKSEGYLHRIQGLNKALEELNFLEPYLSTWSAEKDSVLKATHLSYLKAEAASVVTVRALKAFNIKVNGQVQKLAKDEILEIPQLPNSALQIDELAIIRFGKEGDDNAENSAVLKQAQLHADTLKEIGIASISESEQLLAFHNLLKQKASFEEEFGTEPALVDSINALQAEESSEAELWQAARASDPLVLSDLTAGSEEQGRLKQLREYIESEDYPGQLSKLETQLDEVKEVETKLSLESNSIKLLLDTLTRNRDASRRKISTALVGVLQRHIEGVFGPGAKIALHEDLSFDVLNRDETNVETSALSVGAGEQLALAFRLAIAEVARSKCEIPIILDDEFAHTDKSRLDRIASHLESIDDQQIVLFTHQPEKLAKIKGQSISLGLK